MVWGTLRVKEARNIAVAPMVASAIRSSSLSIAMEDRPPEKPTRSLLSIRKALVSSPTLTGMSVFTR